MLKEYLREREKEVIDIMIMLFDQTYATEQYGIAQKEEGRLEGQKEGRISERIQMYREDGLDDDLRVRADLHDVRHQVRVFGDEVIPAHEGNAVDAEGNDHHLRLFPFHRLPDGYLAAVLRIDDGREALIGESKRSAAGRPDLGGVLAAGENIRYFQS